MLYDKSLKNLYSSSVFHWGYTLQLYQLVITEQTEDAYSRENTTTIFKYSKIMKLKVEQVYLILYYKTPKDKLDVEK